MRSILLLLIPLLAGGAVYWVMTSGDRGPSDAGGDQPLSAGGDDTPAKGLEAEALEVDMSGARVADSMPKDIFDATKAESAVYEQPEVMDTRIKIPDGRETMTGDLILRSMARILGSKLPFHFESAAALAEFKGKSFEGFPGGEASLAELMSYLPRAGFGFFQRDKRLYAVRLPEPETD